MILPSVEDCYHGVTVNSRDIDKSDDFKETLGKALAEWKAEHKRGIWFHIDIKDSYLIPILADNGFVFHHSQPHYVLMNKWLPNTPSTLPKHLHTTIGVGGLVMREDRSILLMREKKGGYLGWKLPGGMNDPMESIFQTASREVFEETGVHAVAKSILMFRHAPYKWPGTSDIYFICAMTLKDENNSIINPCPTETEEAKWFTRSEFEELPRTSYIKFLQLVVERYDNFKSSNRNGFTQDKNGFMISQ